MPNINPGQGDDIGFTLVFGNYGELSYKAPIGKPTIQDSLFIKYPANLVLIDLCLPDNFILFNINDNKVVKECDLLKGDVLYNLQVQKFEDCTWKCDFDLCYHCMY